MSTAAPLRILLVVHLPLRRNLGGARVQIEFAEELRRAGHIVDHYSLDDAFGPAGPRHFGAIAVPSFSSRACRYVRSVAHRYDIVEGHQGDLPCSKEWLGFRGLLVTRSSGLMHSYRDFLQHASILWPGEAKGRLAGRALRQIEWRRRLRATERTFASADLVNLPNDDERARVDGMLHHPGKTVTIPNGIAPGMLKALRLASGDAAIRQRASRIAVVGTWDSRKGAHDWPVILQRVWLEAPSTRFAFLGTGVEKPKIIADLGLESDDRIEVVPEFAPDALPSLLAEATVGALPSHIEGFGLGLVESLAAGLPCVAYDVPGPRETVGRLRDSWLKPVGDHDGFAKALLELLRTPHDEYARLAAECTAFAERFSWGPLAKRTLDIYLEASQQRVNSPQNGRGLVRSQYPRTGTT